MFFSDFCEIFKSTFFTEPLRVTTSRSSGHYLKAYQSDINWGNNSGFNTNTELFLSFAITLDVHKILEISQRNVCDGVPL